MRWLSVAFLLIALAVRTGVYLGPRQLPSYIWELIALAGLVVVVRALRRVLRNRRRQRESGYYGRREARLTRMWLRNYGTRLGRMVANLIIGGLALAGVVGTVFQIAALVVIFYNELDAVLMTAFDELDARALADVRSDDLVLGDVEYLDSEPVIRYGAKRLEELP